MAVDRSKNVGDILVGRALRDAIQPLVDRAAHDLRRRGLHLDLLASQLSLSYFPFHACYSRPSQPPR